MKSVHLMGIGGTGMVSLAGLFTELGWKVRGSDANVYPPASTELARLGVEVREGYRPENLEPRPDLVVVGNVITRKNPEAETLLSSGIKYTSMAQALADYFFVDRRSVVVAGTHGKTTTTSLLAWILDQAGQSPGLFVGGIPLNFGQGYRLGSGKPFVVEGDEYDTAFFEKTPKFLHYKPCDCIVTSIEFDHADIYRDLAHVVEQFEKLMAILPEKGILVANGDSEIVRKVVEKRKGGDTRFYGFGEENAWRPSRISVMAKGTRFDVECRGKKVCTVDSLMLGNHNIANTVAAIALIDGLGVSPEVAAKGVTTFKGVKRRQEFVGEARGIRIYDDFAHHPTAIAETLAAFSPMAKAAGGKLWAVFEPRSNTVRRRVFQDLLPESFSLAQEVLLSPVYKKADSLTDRELLSPDEVAQSITNRGRKARATKSNEEIVEILKNEARSGDTVLFMSNGSFGGIPVRTLEAFNS